MSREKIFVRMATVLILAHSIALPIRAQKSLSEADRVADEMEAVLRHDILGAWFPRSIDQNNGGFYSNFTRDWKLAASNGKFSVFQGRMVWVASQIVMHRPELKTQFLPIIDHGMKYLSEVLWDKQYGGFFWGLDDNGKVSPQYTDGKHLYGMSFGLYGATAAYQATNDRAALALAQKAFRWIDEHAHDARNGGYFEWLTRDGRVVQANPGNARVDAVPFAGFPIDYKSMNTHIHLLESFTQLYEVWKDELLRSRIAELLAIVRDKICVEPGVMNLYFTSDWRAIPDHDSYGHDVETAYLMLETQGVLGQRDPRTEAMARRLVDHALAYGWDETYGGFYREGTSTGPPEDMRKEWWVQFEGLNTLLLMHEKYGKQTAAYFRAFQKEWQFIKDKQIDHEFGGVYDTVERDGTVKDFTKARIWKEAYHDTRALLNVTARLRRLARAG
jgi:mannose/cellobiose epimerase-like protein (N-acyl-D-glucosamine 2-epimerase family)